jgi:hypothetical protein
VESYGRLSQPAMKLLHTLGEEAAGPGGVLRASFVDGGFLLLLSGLDGAACSPLCRADV